MRRAVTCHGQVSNKPKHSLTMKIYTVCLQIGVSQSSMTILPATRRSAIAR